MRVLRDEAARRGAGRSARRAGRSDAQAPPHGRAVARPVCCRFAALGDERGEAQHVVAEARIDSSPITPSRSANRWRMRAASRSGSPVPTSMRNTFPSVRNSAACNSRAPSPRCSSSAQSLAASFSMVPSTSRSSAIGSAKRCSVMRGRNGQARRDRLVLDAERLIEAAHELRAEACRERRARAVEHVGDALQPDLGERFEGFGGRVAAPRGGGGRELSLIAGGNGPHPVGFADHPPPSGEGLQRTAPRPTHTRPYPATATRACSLGASAAASDRAPAPPRRRTDARSRKCRASARRADRARPAAYSGRTSPRPLRAARSRHARPHPPRRSSDASRARRRAACRRCRPSAAAASFTAESRNAPLTGAAMTSASAGKRFAIRSVGSRRSHTDR